VDGAEGGAQVDGHGGGRRWWRGPRPSGGRVDPQRL